MGNPSLMKHNQPRKPIWSRIQITFLGLSCLLWAFSPPQQDGEPSFSHEAACFGTGNLLMEAWLNIGDSHAVADIPVDQAPSYTQLLSQFEIPLNAHDSYGVRLRGYICPPQTGYYTFWMASDDNGELWLSTDRNPANKRRIAHVPGWTNPHIWDKYAEQQSREIYLEAGQSYYVESLMKEGTGGDHLSIKWLKPNGTYDHPIPGAYLSPFEESKSETAACSATGELFMESWLNIGNSYSVADIPVDKEASYTQMLTHFEIPLNVHDSYGVRVRGYICPPQTGIYTFWLSSDDNGELWLSSDRSAANKRRIAQVPGWTNPHIWDKYGEQKSQDIYLEAGQSYYVEALMKEGGGGDHLSVKWRKPDGKEDLPIPGANLSPYKEEESTESRLLLVESQDEVDLCSTGGERVYHFADAFESGDAGFSYTDDPFKGTQSSFYSWGRWSQGVGPSGGSSLGVFLGGRDNLSIWGMSGGWTHSFFLDQEAEVDLSFWYNLIQAAGYEEDEYSEVIYSLDGQEFIVARVRGDGNGGNPRGTGWREEKRSLGRLSPGRHDLVFGGYSNKKTYNTELTQVYIDILEIEAYSVENLAPEAEFSLSRTSEQAPLEVSVDASGSQDPDGDFLTYKWDFGDGTQKEGKQVSHVYTQLGNYAITLVVKDSEGCESEVKKSFNVIQPKVIVNPMEVEVIPIQPSSCDELGRVQIITNRGEISVSHNGQAVEDLDKLLPGVYTWLVVDGKDSQSGEFTISSAFMSPVISSVNSTDVSCGDSDGGIEISFENNVDRVNIAFSLDGGKTYSLKVPVKEGKASFNDLNAGSYDLWVRWGNGDCPQSVQRVVLNKLPAPKVTIDPVGPFAMDAGIQTLTANPQGGTWLGAVNGNGNFDPSVGEGSYEAIYVYDFGNACIGSDTIRIRVGAPSDPCYNTAEVLIPPVGPFAEDAGSQTLIATPVGGTWSGAVDIDGDFDPSMGKGTYEVIYTYDFGQGCIKSDKINITVGPPTDPCFNAAEVLIDGAGPFTEDDGVYRLVASPAGGSWSGPVSADGTFDPSIGQGSYKVEYTYENENGCIRKAEINIQVLPGSDPCQARIDPIGPISPSQNVIQLTASPEGGTWSGDVTPTGAFDPGCPGVYTVIYTHQSGANCQDADTTTIWVKPQVLDIFIVAGQSNAVGVKNTLSILKVGPDPKDSYIQYAWHIPGENTSGSWDIMQLLPVEVDKFGFGPELSFSRQMLNKGYSNLGLIKVAKGGTNLDVHWDPTASIPANDSDGKSGMFPKLISYVSDRLAELDQQSIPYRVAGFFWHQGEGDMNAARAPKYQANLEEFIAALRTEYGSELPFFVASVYNPNASQAEEEAVQLAQKQVASLDPNIFYIDLDTVYYNQNNLPNGANLNSDLLHYNPTGLVKVGNSYANTYQETFPIDGCTEGIGELCEQATNLAFGKPTDQSSTYGLGTSDIAVDGVTEGTSPWVPDLAHTEVENQPWWQVDLGAQVSIEQVKIYNRTDCCFGRLNNFSVFVSSKPFPTNATLTSLRNDPEIYHVTFSGSAGLTELFQIGMDGRYVRIQHSREIQLHVAEVEVWGCSESSQASRFVGASEGIDSELDQVRTRIKVFPNPAKKVLIVQTLQPTPQNQVEMILYNLAGQRVKEVRSTEGVTSIDVSKLARGIYTIQVNGEQWSDISRVQLE